MAQLLLMWLLPSRNRPGMCQEALDAFAARGSTPGVLYVHAEQPSEAEAYVGTRLPQGWEKVVGSEYQANQFRWFFERFPDEPWYGWMADDNRPFTAGFDVTLIEAAGRWRFVVCDGNTGKKWPRSCPSCLVWGGELVRTVGWLAPPNLFHATIDEHWKWLAREADVGTYCANVLVEHLHWSNGRRKRDATDDAPKGKWDKDFQILKQFKETGLKPMAQRVREAMAAALPS